MELAILLVALVVTLAVCFAALRLLAYEFDCVCGLSANGRQRAQRVRQELVDLSCRAVRPGLMNLSDQTDQVDRADGLAGLRLACPLLTGSCFCEWRPI